MTAHGARLRASPGLPARATSISERGFSLVEAIVATVIATIAVTGLAYSFGNARGLVNRYEAARVALAAAQRRMETLSVLPVGASDLVPNSTHDADVVLGGTVVAHESWVVEPFTDPATGSSLSLKKVVVRVTWDGGGAADELQLTRLFPAE
jgi:hypothetical protein